MNTKFCIARVDPMLHSRVARETLLARLALRIELVRRNLLVMPSLSSRKRHPFSLQNVVDLLLCGRGDLTAEGVQHINRPVHGVPSKGPLFDGAGPKRIEELLVVDEVVIRVNVDYLGGLGNVPVVIDLDALEGNMRVLNEGLEFFSRDRMGRRRRVGR